MKTHLLKEFKDNGEWSAYCKVSSNTSILDGIDLTEEIKQVTCVNCKRAYDKNQNEIPKRKRAKVQCAIYGVDVKGNPFSNNSRVVYHFAEYRNADNGKMDKVEIDVYGTLTMQLDKGFGMIITSVKKISMPESCRMPYHLKKGNFVRLYTTDDWTVTRP